MIFSLLHSLHLKFINLSMPNYLSHTLKLLLGVTIVIERLIKEGSSCSSLPSPDLVHFLTVDHTYLLMINSRSDGIYITIRHLNELFDLSPPSVPHW